MIKVTPAAAEQIKLSAQQGKAEGMALRIAATKNADGSLHYAVGFDEAKEEDSRYSSEDIDLLVAPPSVDLLKGTTIDYVELSPGRFEFIFLNPNDPDYRPPQQ